MNSIVRHIVISVTSSAILSLGSTLISVWLSDIHAHHQVQAQTIINQQAAIAISRLMGKQPSAKE